MNKLLQRQIKKIFGDIEDTPSALLPLLQIVSDTYDGFDQDRTLAERSIELSSQELLEANQRIRKESETQNAILVGLRNATAILRPHSDTSKEWLTSKDEVVHLANSLSELIEQEKQHEKELETSQAKTEQERAKAEAILKSIGDGVFAVDLKGQIILINPVAEQFSGFTSEECQGKNYKGIFRFVKEKDPMSPYPPFIEAVIKTGTTKTLENHTLLINRAGKPIPISDSAAPIKDETGKIFGCIVVIRDASRERELERTKDEFISIAAHQLRTPLGSMRWNIEMTLRQSDISDTMRQRIQRIYKGNQRMIALVNDLLNVSIIDQGLVQESPELTDILNVIRTAIQEMDAEAQEHNVSIDLKIQGDRMSQIIIDPKLFREIIQNLLSNAVKYNVFGGRVDIVVVLSENRIKISVADQGMGIPKADQPRVFSKFYRAGNAVKSETSGSGLGLFVVKSYIEKWGGKISFESTENQGTTFYIELPKQIQYEFPPS